MSKVYIVSDKNSNRISESLNDQYVRKGPALFMTIFYKEKRSYWLDFISTMHVLLIQKRLLLMNMSH